MIWCIVGCLYLLEPDVCYVSRMMGGSFPEETLESVLICCGTTAWYKLNKDCLPRILMAKFRLIRISFNIWQ